MISDTYDIITVGGGLGSSALAKVSGNDATTAPGARLLSSGDAGSVTYRCSADRRGSAPRRHRNGNQSRNRSIRNSEH